MYQCPMYTLVKLVQTTVYFKILVTGWNSVGLWDPMDELEQYGWIDRLTGFYLTLTAAAYAYRRNYI